MNGGTWYSGKRQKKAQVETDYLSLKRDMASPRGNIFCHRCEVLENGVVKAWFF